MHHLKHCLSPKVIAGLAVVAVGIWVLAPGGFAAALPVLILAVCPLSMVGMMLLMSRRGHGDGPPADGAGAQDHETEDLRAQVAELERRLGPSERTAGEAR
jgi:hypothetical protein